MNKLLGTTIFGAILASVLVLASAYDGDVGVGVQGFNHSNTSVCGVKFIFGAENFNNGTVNVSADWKVFERTSPMGNGTNITNGTYEIVSSGTKSGILGPFEQFTQAKEEVYQWTGDFKATLDLVEPSNDTNVSNNHAVSFFDAGCE